MKLYYIEPSYVKFLKEKDNKVQYNYDNNKSGRNTKPYVGVVLTINNKDYYAPITSNSPAKKAKGKFEKMSDKTKTIHKIKDGNNILAVVSINNMIPVKQEFVKEVDFNSIPDKKYRFLMQKEINYITKTQDELISKAKFLYNQVSFVENSQYKNFSCDFKLLEKASESYLTQKKEYKIEYSYDKSFSEEQGGKYYRVFVNNKLSNIAIKEDPNVAKVLDKLSERKEYKEKNISADSLKVGIIKPKKLENEIKVTRPENITLNSNGEKIKSEIKKGKSSSMEL